MRVKNIKNTVSVLMGITVLSQVIAFLRESVFAYYFGTSMEADAYVMASQIPVTLFAIVSTAINTVMLPIYTEKKNTVGTHGAKGFLKTASVLFFGLSVAVIVLAEIFAVPLVRIFAPSFDAEMLQVTVRYTRLLFPTIVGTILINVFTVCFNADNDFFFPSVAALTQSVSIIAIMVICVKTLGTEAAVWGSILGIVANLLLILLPQRAVFCEKINLRQAWDDLKNVLYKVIPVTIGVGIAEVNRIIDRAVASGLDTGSITALNYANKLSVVFSALILSAVSAVSFKKFSETYARREFRKRSEQLSDYTVLLIAVLLPITIGALLLKTELIEIAFGRGAFDSDSVAQTADVFFYTAFGIVFTAVREIFSKYFYSSGDTKTPMINSGIGVGINIVLNLILSKFMGAAGLALATTISYVVVCVLLFITIVLREKSFDLAKLGKAVVKLMVAAAAMLLVLLVLNTFVPIQNSILKVMLNLLVGASVYALALFAIDRQLMRRMFGLLFERLDAKG